MDNFALPPHLQRLVDHDISGLDIMHGELKNLMLIAEKNFEAAQNGDPLDVNEHDESDDYHNGRLDALVELYNLTYALSFGIGIRKENRKDGHL